MPGLTFAMCQAGKMTPEVEVEFVEAVKWLDAKGVEVSASARVVWRVARRGWWDAPPRAVWRSAGGGTRRLARCGVARVLGAEEAPPRGGRSVPVWSNRSTRRPTVRGRARPRDRPPGSARVQRERALSLSCRTPPSASRGGAHARRNRITSRASGRRTRPTALAAAAV